MCDSIDAAGGTHRGRQGHGQVDIVDDRSGQDLGIRASLLQPIRGLAQDRRHLAARIGRRDANVRQGSSDANRLAQPNGTSTADGDHRVGTLRLGKVESLVRDVSRGVHCGFSEDASDLAFEDILHRFSLADLLRC